MATITAALVKDLREKTGAGMMDCKAALEANNGDVEVAIDWLRKKGLAKAAKKSGRVAAEGLVAVAVRDNRGVVVEVNSETDFVARNEEFQALVRTVADVAIEKKADVEALLGTHYPGGGTVQDAISNAIATIGENMTLRRAAELHVAHGVIGQYIHNVIAPGLGKIGVIVALEFDWQGRRIDRPLDARSQCTSRLRARLRSTRLVSTQRSPSVRRRCWQTRTPASPPTCSRRSSRAA